MNETTTVTTTTTVSYQFQEQLLNGKWVDSEFDTEAGIRDSGRVVLNVRQVQRITTITDTVIEDDDK